MSPLFISKESWAFSAAACAPSSNSSEIFGTVFEMHSFLFLFEGMFFPATSGEIMSVLG